MIDTNVFVSALKSRNGASFKLVSMIGTGWFDIAVSVPQILEYESVAKRQPEAARLPGEGIDDVLDYVCSVALRQKIFYLWRPFLKDPSDDMLLELAVAAQAQHIVTFNIRHFVGVARFGILAQTPRDFLRHLGAPA
ncbi:MAG: putative toxin-antitoxin system toxin component, PIN family [Spirochaetaceae bacterium]|nr:putative toxin-antitoxin system toxin component, PIN family [Spirochaetaceae bacterium]